MEKDSDLTESSFFYKIGHVIGERLPLLVCVTNSTHFLELNPHWQKVLGWTLEELKSRPYQDFIHPEDLNPSKGAFESSMLNDPGLNWGFRNRYRTKSGGYIWLDWMGEVVNGVGYGIARDVTKLVETEQKLLMNERLVRYADDAIITCDPHCIATSFNKGAERIFGYQETEALGHDIPGLMLIPAYERFEKNHLEKLRQGSNLEKYETIRRRKDGSHVELEVTLTPVRSNTGELLAVATVAKDISERRLHTLRSEQAALMARLGGWEFDLDKNEVSWSREVGLLTGISGPLRLPLNEAVSLAADWAQPLIYRTIQEAIMFGRPVELEIEMGTPDYSGSWVRIKGQPIQVDGKTIKIIGTLQDISEQRAALKKIQDVQTRLVESERLASIGVLTASIAHEINNPLAIVAGKTAMLKTLLKSERFTPDVFSTELDKMAGTVQRMADIINNLKTYSRTGADSEPAKKVSVRAAIASVIELMEPQIQKAGVKVTIDLDTDRLWLKIQEIQLFQILTNLVQNAIEAVQHSSTKEICIEGRGFNNQVILSVTDTGPGVPGNLRSDIFKAFYTTKNTEGDRGLGLGLSLVRRMVERNHGRVYLDAQSPKTRFVLEFQIDSQRTEPFRLGENSGQDFPERIQQVLVVDDEPDLTEMISFFLREKGYEVHTAHSKSEALASLRDRSFDLVVCDYQLGDGTGEGLMREVYFNSPNLKWLFVTAYADLFKHLKDEPQVIGVLPKPVDSQSIISALEMQASPS